jgi:hypothetical protein
MVEIQLNGGTANAIYHDTGKEEFLGEISSEWLSNYIDNLERLGYLVHITDLIKENTCTK